MINMEAVTTMRRSILFCLFFLFLSPGLSAADDEPMDSYSKIAAKIMPAVVTIIVYDYNGNLKHIGSGFFYNDSGDIVTNNHVLEANTRAEIKLISGERYPVGAIIKKNEKTDVIMARTHVPRQNPFLKLATSLPMVGDRIMVAGSPMGLEQSITEGIVSARRNIPGKGEVLQISAPISPGSSGGPVMNMAGEVVGMAAFQMIQGQNLNFAVPVDVIFDNPPAVRENLKFHKNKDGVIIIE